MVDIEEDLPFTVLVLLLRADLDNMLFTVMVLELESFAQFETTVPPGE